MIVIVRTWDVWWPGRNVWHKNIHAYDAICSRTFSFNGVRARSRVYLIWLGVRIMDANSTLIVQRLDNEKMHLTLINNMYLLFGVV